MKSFCYMTKKSRQNEKSFLCKIKSFFFILKGLSAAKNCLRPESAQPQLSQVVAILFTFSRKTLLSLNPVWLWR